MSITPTEKAGFRTDVNGLRAWGVAAVVLYHFGVPGLSGGFVGVDVFFVISGFLMTGLVLRGLERGDLSVTGFYVDRARRILPAAIVLAAALLLLGWWCVTAVDYRTLAKHAVTSLTFTSNIQFWRESGYFDADSHEKWFLHTWSLSVEWQFYLMYPLLLLAGWRVAPHRTGMAALLVSMLLVSVVASAVLTANHPSAAFYGLPTRAWELVAGGLVYLAQAEGIGAGWSDNRRTVMNLTGLTGIAVTAMWFDPLTPWPGLAAALPVGATCLVILAHTTTSRFTTSPVADWLGTRSYSIYLWHWPVVVLLTYVHAPRTAAWIAAGIAVSFVLGEASYRWVESPSRRALQSRPRLNQARWIALPTALLIVAAFIVWRGDGYAGRLPAEVERLAAAAQDLNPNRAQCHAIEGARSPGCILGGTQPAAILWGDSHADAVAGGLAAAAVATDPTLGILQWSYTSCPPLVDAQLVHSASTAGLDCAGFNRWAVAELEKLPPSVPVVMLSRTSLYAYGYTQESETVDTGPLVHFGSPHREVSAESLREFARAVTATACRVAASRPVYLVRPIPEMPYPVPKVLARRAALGLPLSPPEVQLTDYHTRHAMVWAAQDAAARDCGAHVLDPLPYLCDDAACRSMHAGRPVYYDDDHLNEYGNRLLSPMFAPVFSGAARQPPVGAASQPSN